MKTRIIYPKNIWYSKQLSGLTPLSKAVAVYLVSNDNIGLTPIYQQRDMELQFLFGLNNESLERIKEELSKSGLFYFYDEWVLINNDFCYCDYQGRDRVMESKSKELDNIPKEVSDYFKGVVKGLKSGYKPPINPKSKTLNPKSKTLNPKRQKISNIVLEVLEDKKEVVAEKTFKSFVEWFNKEMQTSYKPLNSYKILLSSLISQDISLEDVFKAIESMKKDKFLLGKNKDGKVYLTLDYALDAQHVMKYLNTSVQPQLENDRKDINYKF